MDEDKKKKYQLLKEKNKRKIKEIKWKNDILFQECITSLNSYMILSLEDTQRIFSILENNFPITKVGNIDWNRMDKYTKLSGESEVNKLFNTRDYYYILWDKEDIPCVICDLNTILNCIDDVLAVSFNTWLLSMNGKEVIEFYHEGIITYGKLEV